MFKHKKFSYFILIITFVISSSLLILLTFYNIQNDTNKKFSFLHKKAIPILNEKLDFTQNRLLLIKNYSNAISGMINNLTQYDEQIISDLFKTHFLKELGIFQLRLLSANGIEMIRYDLVNNEVVKSIKLQDKSDRYYYQDAKDISIDDIYFSKFDLNKENGKIEIPYKNTTRVIKKTIINNKIFYIVINYNLTDVFKYSFSALLYDIFLIESNNQINAHLNNKYSFSKQKKTNIFLKDLLFYDNQYVAQKELPGFPYKAVIIN